MTVSDRPSGRVVEPNANHLAGGPARDIKGADGGGSAHPRSRRVGSRRLVDIGKDLSTIERAVLDSLRALHYLTTTQVERMHFRRPDRTSIAASRAARRCLVQLHSLGLVERLERRIGGIRAGSASFVLTLSPAGARLLADPSRRRAREPSRLHLDHVLAVSELVVRLHEIERRGRTHLEQVTAEPDCWRPFAAQHGARGLLKPDLRLTVGVDGQERHWFVEIDRGSEHGPVIRRKMQTYLDAWRAGVEQDSGTFPQVLWLVPDERRGDAIETALVRIKQLPTGLAVIATTEQAIEVLTGGHE
jgi:hypothetical protein